VSLGPHIEAPVGRHHPGTAYEAAEKAGRSSATQRARVCFILSVVGRRGMPADDISLLYNGFFRPRKEIANEMASRLQELRHESKSTRDLPTAPEVEYITDLDPHHNEDLDEADRLKRRNCHGNWALCQRLTDVGAGWETARIIEEMLVEQFDEGTVEDFIEDIERLSNRRLRLVQKRRKEPDSGNH
jgi:hypothetical protein